MLYLFYIHEILNKNFDIKIILIFLCLFDKIYLLEILLYVIGLKSNVHNQVFVVRLLCEKYIGVKEEEYIWRPPSLSELIPY